MPSTVSCRAGIMARQVESAMESCEGRDRGRATGGREAYHAEEVPSMTIEKRRSKVLTVVAEQELDHAHLGVDLFGLVDGLRADGGKANREF